LVFISLQIELSISFDKYLQEIWSLARGFLTGAYTPGKEMLFVRGLPLRKWKRVGGKII
jgi:hypothetical protein